MVVETRYAAGEGVLVGSGLRWLLVTDPGDEAVLAAVWDALHGESGHGPGVTERVLAVLRDAFGGDPPALAMVDLSGGLPTSLVRGSGQVQDVGSARRLALDGDAERVASARPLVGGIVAAAYAEVRPTAPGAATARGGTESAPVPVAGVSGGLIDGIPEAILAAKGPEGPPPPRPRPQVERPVRPGAEADPGRDTGGLRDTSEPDPGSIRRIEGGGHTTLRAPAQASGIQSDGDGKTVHRPRGDHLRQHTPETVLAASCPLGHLTPATGAPCRICRRPVAPQEPQRVVRPTLGGLRLPTGEVVPLDRGVVIGRRPAPLDGSDDWPHLVHLPADHSFVSRMHLSIELDGWQVLARDLASRGGTVLKRPGREPERMRSGEPYVLEPGCTLDLAEAYEVHLEVGPVAPR